MSIPTRSGTMESTSPLRMKNRVTKWAPGNSWRRGASRVMVCDHCQGRESSEPVQSVYACVGVLLFSFTGVPYHVRWLSSSATCVWRALFGVRSTTVPSSNTTPHNFHSSLFPPDFVVSDHMEIREYDMMTDEAHGITAVFVGRRIIVRNSTNGMSRAEPRICWLLETAAPWRHAVSTLISTMPINPDVG